jgi:hypothetical protein
MQHINNLQNWHPPSDVHGNAATGTTTTKNHW